MKAKRFLKKLGIMLVPAIATILVLVAFDMMFDMSWDVSYDKDPLQPIAEIAYRGSIHAISRVLFGIVLAVWVFACLMNWAKRKIANMKIEAARQDIESLVGGDDDSSSSEQKTEKEMARLEYASHFSLDITRIDWHRSRRFFFAHVGDNSIFSMLNLDLPGAQPDDADNFWSNCDAFIHGFWVFESARNKGLGSCLLNAVENLCKSLKCETVALRYDDRESEPWVLEWYKRSGYEEKFLEGDGHSHFLVKKLSDKKDENPSNDENQE